MFRRLSRRERIVIAAGAAVVVVALALAWVVIPQARRWSEREARISLKSEQLARLEGVLAQETEVRDGLAALQRERQAADRRLLQGGTVAVAGSNLQLLLNRYVADSGMDLERVDAVGQAADQGPLLQIPARITVRGDIRELVDLLVRLQGSETLLAVEELGVSSTPVRGQVDVITASISLHGYARSPEADG
jgi:type II secretory pathway component PulM